MWTLCGSEVAGGRLPWYQEGAVQSHPEKGAWVCKGERKVSRVKSPRFAVGSSLGLRGKGSGRLSPRAMACVS